MDFLSHCSIILLVRYWLPALAILCVITGTTILRISFGILSESDTLLFRSFLTSLHISSDEIFGLTSTSLRSGCSSLAMSLRSALPIVGKNFSAKIFAFSLLSAVSRLSGDLLRFGRWGSSCDTPAHFWLYRDKVQSPLLWVFD